MAKNTPIDDYVMYILVNNELKMGKGKIASQCMHSACAATRILERLNKKDYHYSQWIKDGEAKIVLKSTQKEMIALLENFEVDKVIKRESDSLWCTCTYDAGRTQIAEGSLTTLVFRPTLKEKLPLEVKKMTLL